MTSDYTPDGFVRCPECGIRFNNELGQGCWNCAKKQYLKTESGEQ
jgi:hypothetical protein